MNRPERYTVFEEGAEEQTKDFGLSIEAAFKLIMKLCDYEYRLGQSGSNYVMVMWQRSRPDLGTREETAAATDVDDARREIMLRSFDGRFKTYRAMTDGEFEKHRREAFAFQASDVDFDERKAIKDLQRRQHLRVVKD